MGCIYRVVGRKNVAAAIGSTEREIVVGHKNVILLAVLY
jgi:hypothetical protein